MIADLRLAVPVAIAWIAVTAGLHAPDLLLPGALVAGVLAAAAVTALVLFPRLRSVRARRSSGGGQTVVAAATLAAVMTGLLLASAAARADDRRPVELLDAAASARPVLISATTTELVAAGDDSFTATVDAIEPVGDARSGDVAPIPPADRWCCRLDCSGHRLRSGSESARRSRCGVPSSSPGPPTSSSCSCSRRRDPM